jgi:hypothetical protein
MSVGRRIAVPNEDEKKDYYIWSEWREKGETSSGAHWLS